MLTLKVINENEKLSAGTTIVITPWGTDISGRDHSDGKTYFGTIAKENDVIVNDIVLPKEEG